MHNLNTIQHHTFGRICAYLHLYIPAAPLAMTPSSKACLRAGNK
ncbi:hypothetical protein DPX39_100101900 [Trypanosoma brucei equiperdum]|uniref:Uncharacterized protein n=1 Tax=Trypanosoma brucei equiperdum TaxID=630700 RepID=A0A3L6L3Q3_9TRYP|nr:hypothetical protein DPX39_100101900 [Trypanosoma brucei equiperdum]